MRKLTIFIILTLLVMPSTLSSQDSTTTDTTEARNLWVPALGYGIYSSALFFDKPVNKFIQKSRSPLLEDVSSVTREMGEKKVQISSILGITAVGFVTGEDEVKRLGIDMGKSLIATGAVTYLGKIAVGRLRPNMNEGPHEFEPFSSDHLSFPSGHTSSAFAIATPVVEFLKPKVPDLLAYTPYALAGLTGWSRMNDNKHWLSDVAMGATTGILTSKLVTNKIKIFSFNLEPSLQASQHKTKLGFRIKF